MKFKDHDHAMQLCGYVLTFCKFMQRIIVALIIVLVCALAVVMVFPTSANAATVKDVCSWDKPGANPFTGSVPAAVDRYTDIPMAVRARLKERMEKRQYDEIAVIERDSIIGQGVRYEDLRQMHFGNGQLCKTVSRAKWSDQARERGLIYCESGYCLIVPTVCRNVSRVTAIAQGSAGGGGSSTGAATAPQAPLPSILAPTPTPGLTQAQDEPFGFPLAAPDMPILVPDTVQPGYVLPPFNVQYIQPPMFVPSIGYYVPPIASPVPEPASWMMMALGLFGVVVGKSFINRRKA
jgi:hypothetical protein